LIPSRYEVFGPDRRSAEEVRSSIGPVAAVFAWARAARRHSRADIASLSDANEHHVAARPEFGMPVAQWAFVTAVHAAMHPGRMQVLRTPLAREHDRAGRLPGPNPAER